MTPLLLQAYRPQQQIMRLLLEKLCQALCLANMGYGMVVSNARSEILKKLKTHFFLK